MISRCLNGQERIKIPKHYEITCSSAKVVKVIMEIHARADAKTVKKCYAQSKTMDFEETFIGGRLPYKETHLNYWSKKFDPKDPDKNDPTAQSMYFVLEEQFAFHRWSPGRRQSYQHATNSALDILTVGLDKKERLYSQTRC
ncbi:hypothetical protein ACTXT7_004324 [Hymenolepis weldensis]